MSLGRVSHSDPPQGRWGPSSDYKIQHITSRTIYCYVVLHILLYCQMQDRKQCRTHGLVDDYFQSQPQSSPSFTPAKTWNFNDYRKVTRWPDKDGQQQSGFIRDLGNIQDSCSKDFFSSNDHKAAAEALEKYQVSRYLYPSPLFFWRVKDIPSWGATFRKRQLRMAPYIGWSLFDFPN